MAEHDPNDELSVEELEDVSGGNLADNGNCGASCTNTNCTKSCIDVPPSSSEPGTGILT